MSDTSETVFDRVSDVAKDVQKSGLDNTLPAYGKLAVDLLAHANALDGWLNELIMLFPTHARPPQPPTPPPTPSDLPAAPSS